MNDLCRRYTYIAEERLGVKVTAIYDEETGAYTTLIHDTGVSFVYDEREMTKLVEKMEKEFGE